MLDGSWIRSKVDAVMLPVVRLFLQTQATLAARVTALQTLLTTKMTTIEDYGAIGDGVADDTPAFLAYAAALRASANAGQKHHKFLLGSARRYRVTNSIDFTNFTNTLFDLNGSAILISGVSLTAPLIDMLGSTHCRMINGQILATDSTHPLQIGVLVGRVNSVAAPYVSLENVTISGYFTRTVVQNSAGDFFTGTDVTLINSTTTATAYGVIHDATGYWTTPSIYVPGNTLSNAPGVTCNNISFSNSSIQTAGGSAIWKNASDNHVEENCNFSVPVGRFIFTLMFQTDTDSSPGRAANITGLDLRNITTSTHASFFYLTGNVPAGYNFNYLSMTATTINSGSSLFALDPSYGSTSVRIRDANLRVPVWTNSAAKVFDTPVQYFVTGTIELLYSTPAVWNTPSSFHGTLCTNNHLLYTFNNNSTVSCIDDNGWWAWKNNAWNSIAMNSETRTRLTANTTFYVNASTGSDTTGTGTIGSPWLTIQHAAHVVQNTYDLSYTTITFACSGNFTSGTWLTGLFVGQGSTATVVFDGGGTAHITATGGCFGCANGAQFTVQNFAMLTTTGSTIGGGGSIFGINEGSIAHFGNTFGNSVNAHIAVYGSGAMCVALGNYNIAGGAPSGHISAGANGVACITAINPIVVAISSASGTPNFPGGFVSAAAGGFISYPNCSFSGNTTGPRYNVYFGGIIYTGGGGPNYFPGNSAGLNDGTGIYDGITPIGAYSYAFDVSAPPASPINLQPRDRCVVYFNGTPTIPLHISTQQGVYRVTLAVFWSNTNNSDLLWLPNDTTYPGAFTSYWTGVSDLELTAVGTATSPAVTTSITSSTTFVGKLPITTVDTSKSAFYIDQFSGPGPSGDYLNAYGPSLSEFTVSTSIIGKMIRAVTGITGGTTSVFVMWHDTTTPWTSLGTIVDMNGTSMTGTVTIERLA